MAISNPAILNNNEVMKNTKATKKEVMKEIKERLEVAKLNLIYTELESANIQIEKKYSTVKELLADTKKTISTLDYNRLSTIVKNIDDSLNGMVGSLEAGSTNAFTKLMTSDLAKSIAKTLGISLAGRTALILAPTIGTKALVGVGLGAYSLYKVIKNRKDIIIANESNELNNILMEMETSKIDGKIVDTRFSEDMQKDIRKFLKDSGIVFEDTGYRSLRQTIYSLDSENKRGLCDLLNIKYGKGIEVDSRVNKAKKKLNVVASTATSVGVGATVGVNLATAINSVDPGLLAGTLNGTLLGAWISSQTQSAWYGALSGGLTLIGTEVLQHLPVVGKFAEKVFAAENLAALGTIGATGGLIAGATMGLVSAGMNIYKSINDKKVHDEFVKMDGEKYKLEDEKEIAEIRKKLYNPPKFVENIVLDLINGYFKDEGIDLGFIPKDIDEVRVAVSKLPDDKRKRANQIISLINSNIEQDPSFVSKLKNAGKISIGLFTAGLAVMSVYDIIKGGTFLPEVSRALFPTNNIHNPIPVPEPYDKPFDQTNRTEQALIEKNEEFYNKFNSEEYMVENDGNSTFEYGLNYTMENPNAAGYFGGKYAMEAGMAENAAPKWLTNFLDWVVEICGGEAPAEFIPNVPAISDKIDTLSTEQLYEFYRYFAGVKDDGSPMYRAISEALSYAKPLEKVSEYVNGYQRTQDLHNLINKISAAIGNGSVPIAVGLEALGVIQKRDSGKDFEITQEEIQSVGLGR